jgi:hypothetical protein
MYFPGGSTGREEEGKWGQGRRRLFMSSEEPAVYDPNDWQFNPNPNTDGYPSFARARDTCSGANCAKIYLSSSLGAGQGATDVDLTYIENPGYSHFVTVAVNMDLQFFLPGEHEEYGGRRLSQEEQHEYDPKQEQEQEQGGRRLVSDEYSYTEVNAPSSNALSFQDFHYNDLAFAYHKAKRLQQADLLVTIMGVTYTQESYANVSANAALAPSFEPDVPEELGTDYIRATVPIFRNTLYHKHSVGSDDLHLLISDQTNGELLALAPAHLMPCGLTYQPDQNSYLVNSSVEALSTYGVTFVNTLVDKSAGALSIRPDSDFRLGDGFESPCLKVDAGLTTKNGVAGYPYHNHHCQLDGYTGYTLYRDGFCSLDSAIGRFHINGTADEGKLTDHVVCQIQGLSVDVPARYPTGFFPYWMGRANNFFVANFGRSAHVVLPVRNSEQPLGLGILCNGADFADAHTASVEKSIPYNIWLDNDDFRNGIIASIVLVVVMSIVSYLYTTIKHKEGDVVVYRLAPTVDHSALERLLGSELYDFCDMTRHKHGHKFEHWFPEETAGAGAGGAVSPMPDKKPPLKSAGGDGGTDSDSDSDFIGRGSGSDDSGDEETSTLRKAQKQLKTPGGGGGGTGKDPLVSGETAAENSLELEEGTANTHYRYDDFHRYHVNYLLSYALHYCQNMAKLGWLKMVKVFWIVYPFAPPLWLLKISCVTCYRVCKAVYRFLKKLIGFLLSVWRICMRTPCGRYFSAVWRTHVAPLYTARRKNKPEHTGAHGSDTGGVGAAAGKAKFGLAVLVKDQSNGLLMLHPLCKLPNYKFNKEVFSEELEECLELLDYKTKLSRHRAFKLQEEKEKARLALLGKRARRGERDLALGSAACAQNDSDESSSDSEDGSPRAAKFHKIVAEMDSLLGETAGGGGSSAVRGLAGSVLHPVEKQASKKAAKQLWGNLKSKLDLNVSEDDDGETGAGKSIGATMGALFDPSHLKKMVAQLGAKALTQQWTMGGDAEQPHYRWAFVEEEGHGILSLRHHRIIKRLDATVECKVRRNRDIEGGDALQNNTEEVEETFFGKADKLAAASAAAAAALPTIGGRSRGSILVNRLVAKEMTKPGEAVSNKRSSRQSSQGGAALPGLPRGGNFPMLKKKKEEVVPDVANLYSLEKTDYNFLKQNDRSKNVLRRISMAIGNSGILGGQGSKALAIKKKIGMRKHQAGAGGDVEMGGVPGMVNMRQSELVGMQTGAAPASRVGYSKKSAVQLLKEATDNQGALSGTARAKQQVDLAKKRSAVKEFDPFPREVVMQALPPEEHSLWEMKLSMNEMQTLYECSAEARSEEELRFKLIMFANRGVGMAGGDGSDSSGEEEEMDYMPPPPPDGLRQRKLSDMGRSGSTVNPLHAKGYDTIEAVSTLLTADQNDFLHGESSRPQYTLARLKTQRRIAAEQRRLVAMQVAAGLSPDEQAGTIDRELNSEPIIDWTYVKSYGYTLLRVLGLDFSTTSMRGKECYSRIRDRAGDWETESLLKIVQPREERDEALQLNAFQSKIHDYTISEADGASRNGGLGKVNRCYFIRDPIDWKRMHVRYSTTVTEFQLLDSPPQSRMPHVRPLLKYVAEYSSSTYIAAIMAFTLFCAWLAEQVVKLWVYLRSGVLCTRTRIFFFGKSTADLQREKAAATAAETEKAKVDYAVMQRELATKGDLRGMARTLSMKIDLSENVEKTSKVLAMFGKKPVVSATQSRWQKAAAAVRVKDVEYEKNKPVDSKNELRENFSGKGMWKKAFFRTKLMNALGTKSKDPPLTPAALRAAVKLKRQSGGALKKVKVIRASSSSNLSSPGAPTPELTTTDPGATGASPDGVITSRVGDMPHRMSVGFGSPPGADGAPLTPVVGDLGPSSSNLVNLKAISFMNKLGVSATKGGTAPLKKFETDADQRRAERFARALSSRSAAIGGVGFSSGGDTGITGSGPLAAAPGRFGMKKAISRTKIDIDTPSPNKPAPGTPLDIAALSALRTLTSPITSTSRVDSDSTAGSRLNTDSTADGGGGGGGRN